MSLLLSAEGIACLPQRGRVWDDTGVWAEIASSIEAFTSYGSIYELRAANDKRLTTDNGVKLSCDFRIPSCAKVGFLEGSS